jgi:glutathione S-transferase
MVHTKLLPPEQRKPELVADSVAKLPKKFAVLEAALARSPWLAGPGVHDRRPTSRRAVPRPPVGLDRWPKLKDWHTRCTTRLAAVKR